MANIQKQLIIYHLSLIIVLSALYNCRFPTTNVMKVRQIHPFLQNEPNFRKSQMNVTKEMKKDYEKKDTWWSGKNEPKTNPIRTQTKPISEAKKCSMQDGRIGCGIRSIQKHKDVDKPAWLW